MRSGLQLHCGPAMKCHSHPLIVCSRKAAKPTLQDSLHMIPGRVFSRITASMLRSHDSELSFQYERFLFPFILAGFMSLFVSLPLPMEHAYFSRLTPLPVIQFIVQDTKNLEAAPWDPLYLQICFKRFCQFVCLLGFCHSTPGSSSAETRQQLIPQEHCLLRRVKG